MEQNGVQLEERPDEAAEAERARALEEKRKRQETAAKKKKRKILRKRLITLAVVLLICGGIGFGMYKLFHEEEPEKTIWSEPVMRGSITSTVTGSGTTKALNSKTLTLGSGGTVREVFVTSGQHVEEGEPLYNVDSTEAEKAVRDAQKSIEDAKEAIKDAEKTVQNYQKDLENLNKRYADLNFTAPFAGKLMEVEDLQAGDTVSSGQKLGTLVDDRTMKLTLYFSYAYEASFTTGKAVTVSIPATMQTVPGTVSEINKIRRVTPEGSTLFEAVISIPNPGTLTAGMGATAYLSGDGEIYPYEPGTLEYSRSKLLTLKEGGELVQVNLRDYEDVAAGALLAQTKAEDLDTQRDNINSSISSAQETVRSRQEELKKAEESLENAEKALENYYAVAPISGTVISLNLTPGEVAEANRTAISIADTSVMLVDIRVDSMNITYIEPGMPCDLTMYGSDGDVSFSGMVESVDAEGKSENGYSYFPATVRVDNPDGTIRPGMPVDYSMVASQSEDCLLVANQAVKQSALGPCVFVEGTPGENALDPAELGLELPEGYYAVAVTVGLSDQQSAEIVEGVEEGQNVFVQYMTNSGDSWSGGYGMMVG